jgi:hypothetical protein
MPFCTDFSLRKYMQYRVVRKVTIWGVFSKYQQYHWVKPEYMQYQVLRFSGNISYLEDRLKIPQLRGNRVSWAGATYTLWADTPRVGGGRARARALAQVLLAGEIKRCLVDTHGNRAHLPCNIAQFRNLELFESARARGMPAGFRHPK